MIRYAKSTDGVTPEQLGGFFEGWPSPPSPGTHLRARASGSADASYGMVVWKPSPTGYLATRRILIWDPTRSGRARIGRCNARPTTPRPIF